MERIKIVPINVVILYDEAHTFRVGTYALPEMKAYLEQNSISVTFTPSDKKDYTNIVFNRGNAEAREVWNSFREL